MSKEDHKTSMQSNALITNYTIRYSNAKCTLSTLSPAEMVAIAKKAQFGYKQCRRRFCNTT